MDLTDGCPDLFPLLLVHACKRQVMRLNPERFRRKEDLVGGQFPFEVFETDEVTVKRPRHPLKHLPLVRKELKLNQELVGSNFCKLDLAITFPDLSHSDFECFFVYKLLRHYHC